MTTAGYTSLSKSSIWDLQRKYYRSHGLSCWKEGLVPSFVSSNAFVAKQYSELIISYLNDHYSSDANRNQPVHILEIGAGHGRLSFLILMELMDSWQQWPDLGTVPESFDGTISSCNDFGIGPNRLKVPFRVVISDFSSDMVEFWKNHESLLAYYASGVVDYACLDAECALDEIKLTRYRIARGDLLVPLVTVCNYLFDSLRQDAFMIRDNEISEYLCKTELEATPEVEELAVESSPKNSSLTVQEQEKAESLRLSRMSLSWEQGPIDELQGRLGAESDLQKIVQFYKEVLGDACVCIPSGSISLINELRSFVRAPLFIIAGDKGYNHLDEIPNSLDHPHIALHGSISFMVNFHALRLHCLLQGGASLHTPYLEGFKVSSFFYPKMEGLDERKKSISTSELIELAADVLSPQLTHTYRRTTLQWAQSMDAFSVESFSQLQRLAKDELPSGSCSLQYASSIVRLANHDPDVFMKFRTTYIEKTPGALPTVKADIYHDLRSIYRRYFPLQTSKDVAFELGRVAMGLLRFPEAVELFIASNRWAGEHYITDYNAGICLFHLKEYSTSLRCFQASIALKPDNPDSRLWSDRTRNRLEDLHKERLAKFKEKEAKLGSLNDGSRREQEQNEKNWERGIEHPVMDDVEVSINILDSERSIVEREPTV